MNQSLIFNAHIQCDICRALDLEDAVNFLSALGVERLDCAFPFFDSIDNVFRTLPGITPQTISVYRLIKKQGANEALEWMAHEGKLEEFNILLKTGIDLKSFDSFRPGILFTAIVGKSIPMINQILDSGIDVNYSEPESGMTALLSSAGDGYVELMQLFLDRGANINDRYHDGHTLVMSAARFDNFEAVRFLLEKGLDQSKHEALVLAATNSRKIMRLLIQIGANIETEFEGFTPLMEAVNSAYVKNVKFILEAGANPDHIVDGRTAFDLNCDHYQVDKINKMLLKARAKFQV